jgi:(p)ppGpp synthase/HD superfamily hydrolase
MNNDTLLILSAASFAAEAHKDQKRKELPDPYINHPIRVAKMAASLNLSAFDIAAALLHDVVEDTSVPMATIEQLFPERTVMITKALTKWWKEGHPAEVVRVNKTGYYGNILVTDGAPVIKVLDRIDNLYDFARIARLSPKNHKWAERYLEKSRAEFGPLLDKVAQSHKTAAAVLWYENAIKALEDAC